MFATDSPRHVVLFRDLQLHLDQSDPILVRRIKDILRLAKANGHSIILLGCRLKLPPELEHEITHVDFSLPDPARLGVVLDGIISSATLDAPDETTREAALQSALGLTTTEAENAFALSVVETKGIDHKVVAREKARTLKKNGLVEVVEATTSLDDIRAIPRALLHYAQICDAQAGLNFSTEDMIHTARCERLLPGDGTIDVQGLFDALPADLPVSVEVVNFGREAHTSVQDWAAECLAKSRPFVEA